MLRGENFLLDFVDKEKKYGFYTAFWVEANDPEEAELNAVAKVKEKNDLRSGLLNYSDNPPMICLEEINQLGSKEKLEENSGRTFFVETDDKEVKYFIKNAGGNFGNKPFV